LRLGYESIDEIKSHAYFAGINWDSISASRVPYNPPQPRRPVRLAKNPMSSSFSNANNKSPLISVQSPSMSQASSPINSTANQRSPAFFGKPKDDDPYFYSNMSQKEETKNSLKAGETSPIASKSEGKSPQKECPGCAPYILRGVLRKKGLIFLNERDVTINSDGILNYYHFDKPGEAKGSIDLASAHV
jgi:hypothetical protein